MFREIDMAWTCNESAVNAFESDWVCDAFMSFAVSWMTLSAVARKSPFGPGANNQGSWLL